MTYCFALNNLRRVILILVLKFFVSSCGTVRPDAPINSQLDFEIPSQPESFIKIPVKLNLRPYFYEADKSVPYRFKGKDSPCEGVSYSYKFYRGPINFKGQNDKIIFDVNGKYSLKLNYCPQCTSLFDKKGTCIVPRIYSSCGVKEALRKIEIGYSTKIRLTQDYHLNSITKLQKVKALSPCIVSVFEYDATTTLKQEITVALQNLESEIDSVISTVDLKPDLSETWDYFTSPMDLEGYGFLYINPSAVAVSPIKFQDDTAYFSAIIKVKPQILTNASRKAPQSLPYLTKFENRDGFDVTMDIFSTYDSLSSILTSNVKGQIVEIKNNKIAFENINIHGASDHKLHLKIDFIGDKKGTLYLTGTPTFDSTTQNIQFDDLVFDVKTKSALLKSAKWMFDKKITTAVRRASKINLSPYLESLRHEINYSINGEVSEEVYMNGDINSMLINLIRPMENQLFIRIRSLGELRITM